MKTFNLAVSLVALAVGGGAYAGGMMGDKDITRAEAQQMASTMFAKMDANNDGLLNDADRDARMGQMFDSLDTDKNGSISREEFLAAHSGPHGMHDKGMDDHDGMKMGGDHKGGMEGGHHGMGGMGRMGGHHEMMMNMADKNKDGAISATEFTEAHLAMFDKADANHDGTLTAAERKTAMEQMHAQMKAAPAAPAE